MPTTIEVIKWKGAWPKEAIHVKKCGQDVGQGERQEVAMNKSPVIVHIKARSKVLISQLNVRACLVVLR